MLLREWFRPPRRLLLFFLAVTLLLVGVLGRLSWHLLQQDRALEAHRIQERLDHAADVIATALLRGLSEREGQLADLLALPDSRLAAEAARQARGLPKDALLVVLRPQGVDAYPQARLVYLPALPSAPEPPASVFAEGEANEFKRNDYAKATAIFRELSRYRAPTIRAVALLRLARNLRKTGQPEAALTVYEDLGRIGSAYVEGLPAELLARHARCICLRN